MSMALMVAMAARNKGAQERRNEGTENRGEGEMEMRRRRDERGRYMEDDRMEGEMRRDERGRYMEGRRMEGEMRRNETGRYMEGGRMEGEMRRDERGRYMEEGRMRDGYGRWEDPMGREMRRGHKDPHDPQQNPYDDEEPREERRSRRDIYGGEISYERPDGAKGNISYFRAKPQEDREKMMGFRQQSEGKGAGFDKQTAMEWVENMEDKDGVKGGMYTWHQAQQYGRNMGITGEQRLVEFFAAMNAMYSDYHAVGKKFGVDRPEFYAHLAKCFIEDPDAVEDKVAMYYECIARKE